ncbi:phytanoyl-CoA dioxygenase family protein [Paenibacillus cymbidii]|uniref:phytanoyl-CoA dioxygenase family protein n=1 Tax=Paenibacillus cymbidii TaxID=1639034 RepID=UPI001F452782|nr:phytanoyl-CoA dioxygenase family protein [Paenibacillus cymbidii]
MIKQARLAPLSQQQVENYERDGFIVLRKACSDDLIDAYNAHIHSIRSADLEHMPAWARPQRGSMEFPEHMRFAVRLFNPHLHDGFSLQMMKLPVVRGALAQLLGDEAVGVQSMYFYKEPGSPGQAAHQDYYYIRNDPNTLIAAWVAMERVDTENGCLWAIPGSHKLGLLDHGKVKNLEEHEAWTYETEGADLSKEVPLEMEKGDIVIFHNLLIHSSNRNRSADRWRRSYVCHYIRHDSSIVREDLKKKIALE